MLFVTISLSVFLLLFTSNNMINAADQKQSKFTFFEGFYIEPKGMAADGSRKKVDEEIFLGDDIPTDLVKDGLFPLNKEERFNFRKTLRAVNKKMRDSYFLEIKDMLELDLHLSGDGEFICPITQMIDENMRAGNLLVKEQALHLKRNSYNKNGFSKFLGNGMLKQLYVGVVAYDNKNVLWELSKAFNKLPGNAPLQTLRFQGPVGFYDNLGLSSIIQKAPHLQAIHMRDAGVNNFTAQQISKELKKEDSSIKQIDFCGSKINDTGAHFFVEVLKQNTSLTDLDLYNSKIRTEGVHILKESLRNNKTLKRVFVGIVNGELSSAQEKALNQEEPRINIH